MSSREAFHRPNTLLNRLADRLARFTPRRTITEDHIRHWRENTYEILLKRKDTKESILNKIVTDTNWQLSSESPPENVWFGEAKFGEEGDTPLVQIYERSHTTRLPLYALFNLAGQAGIDHVFGHLYPFHAGEKDFGEEVACRMQHCIAQERAKTDVAWMCIPWMTRMIYKFHKNIPLSNYK